MRSVLNESGSNLKDVIEILANVGKKNNKNNNYLQGSISRYTKNLIMSFPVLFDDTLQLSTAQLISKANEKNIASMMQMAFASISMTGNNGADVIASMHHNLDKNDGILNNTGAKDALLKGTGVGDVLNSYGIGESVDVYMEAMNEAVESIDCINPITEAEIRDAEREILSKMRNDNKVFAESFSEKSLNSFAVKNLYGQLYVCEADDNDLYAYAKNAREEDKEEREKAKYKEDEEDRKLKRERDKAKEERDKRKDDTEFFKSQVVNSDFKKANDLQPTTLVINSYDANTEQRLSFVAGIKCRLVAVSGIDIAERLASKAKTKLSFKNLIKATTGEISFLGDFIFCLKQAKINAKNAVKKGEAAVMWNTLEKRAAANAVNKASRNRNDASAITSLVINQETVNYIKSNYNVDLNNVKDASFMMNAYNLLAIIICDDSVESAKFLYDGNDNYEVVSYRGLSKSIDDDKDVKMALNAINKMGR